MPARSELASRSTTRELFMIIIRPIQPADYDGLHQIAIESGHGFTSLPVNETLLQNRINGAQESFQKSVTQPGTESYLFVMEDTETGEVVGTAGVEAAVGLEDAFYHYHLGKVVHNSRELKYLQHGRDVISV